MGLTGPHDSQTPALAFSVYSISLSERPHLYEIRGRSLYISLGNGCCSNRKGKRFVTTLSSFKEERKREGGEQMRKQLGVSMWMRFTLYFLGASSVWYTGQ